jgi:hypothetical protein
MGLVAFLSFFDLRLGVTGFAVVAAGLVAAASLPFVAYLSHNTVSFISGNKCCKYGGR